MTRQILVIGGRTTDVGESTTMANYAEYFSAGITDVSALFVHFDELSFVIAPDRFVVRDHRNHRELKTYDLIIFRGKVRANSELAYCVSRYCERNSITFFNDYTPHRPSSKVSQAVTFHELGVAFTKTIYAMDTTILRRVVEAELTAPFIVKDSYGSHGNDNYLVKSLEELETILDTSPDKKFIAQEFFPNNCDYRVLCIGEESFIIRRTSNDGSHLNNTSQGGYAEIVETDFFPPESIRQAHRIAHELRMGIAGVDLLYNDKTGEYVFLEVNSQPQLNSGAFPGDKQRIVRRFIESLL